MRGGVIVGTLDGFDDAPLRQRSGAVARALAQGALSWSAIVDTVERAYDHATARHAEGRR